MSSNVDGVSAFACGWILQKLGYTFEGAKKEYARRRARGDSPETIEKSLRERYDLNVVMSDPS